MNVHRIAVIPGDGIGVEVMEAAQVVLDRAAGLYGFTLQWTKYDWGCEYFLKNQRMMAPDGMEQLAVADSILLGAVGFPGVPDHISLWQLLIPIRREFRQYINLRPVRLLRGVNSPLRNVSFEPDRSVDILCVRENNEGEYSEIGGRLYRGTPDEMAVQESIFTRRGVERVHRYAFELAAARRRSVASATKSNGIIHTMPFWDDIFAEIGDHYPGIDASQYHIDALAALLVLDPQQFDVIVASNLFGDVLTDLGAAVVGSIGIAPSANLNPEGDYPSMFEPVHGSAPDIAGRGVANPIGQMWSGAMMLGHLGYLEAEERILEAIEDVLESGLRTPDLGGSATTLQVAEAIVDALRGPNG